jgi:hypothetical protein
MRRAEYRSPRARRWPMPHTRRFAWCQTNLTNAPFAITWRDQFFGEALWAFASC